MPAQRISEFDLWQPGYAGAVVRVYIAGTTTLASIYTDEALSVAASNPQTLSSTTINGDTYGKFAAPLKSSTYASTKNAPTRRPTRHELPPRT